MCHVIMHQSQMPFFSCHSGKQEMTNIMRHCLSLYEFFLFLADKVKILLFKYGSASVIEEILNYNLRSGEGEWRLNIIKS